MIKRIFLWIDDVLVPRLNRIVPNPSGQNQLSDHTFPTFFVASWLLMIPTFGFYIWAIVPIMSLIKELYIDGHYKDFFTRDDTPFGGTDGRCDLFYRLLGSALAYLMYFI